MSMPTRTIHLRLSPTQKHDHLTIAKHGRGRGRCKPSSITRISVTSTASRRRCLLPAGPGKWGRGSESRTSHRGIGSYESSSIQRSASCSIVCQTSPAIHGQQLSGRPTLSGMVTACATRRAALSASRECRFAVAALSNQTWPCLRFPMRGARQRLSPTSFGHANSANRHRQLGHDNLPDRS